MTMVSDFANYSFVWSHSDYFYAIKDPIKFSFSSQHTVLAYSSSSPIIRGYPANSFYLVP